MVPGWLQILLVIVLAILLFGGRGKISDVMGDFAKGIKSFKKGIQEDPDAESTSAENDPKTIDHKVETEVARAKDQRKAS
ncbi:MAG: twin-arginine translocase TatA/TatE family subunit [Alphaproteobacteria bacterium]